MPIRLSSVVRRAAQMTALAIVAIAPGWAWASGPIGTAFTYQGSLTDAGMAANGQYDFRFTLWDDPNSGNAVSGTLTVDDLPVTNGIFSLELDFGPVTFSVGEGRWMLIEVRPGASTGAYTAMPRQHVAPTPSALALSLPFNETLNHGQTLFTMTNTGTGSGAEFTGGGGATLNYGAVGTTWSTAFQAAGLRGVAIGASGSTIGVEGVSTTSATGTGLVGRGSATGAYVEATGATSTGLYAYGKLRALYAENTGTGSAIYATGNGATRTNPTVRIVNTQPSQGMCEYVTNNSTWATTHMQNDGSGEVLWIEKPTPGNLIVATNGSSFRFWVDSDGMTHTHVLEILGGSDLSERFDVAGSEDTIEPGMLVSIDPECEGRLTMSTQPYDHLVAGIISGAGGVKTGMLMGQQGTVTDGAHAVALTGRVYCRATAANGPIAPGDLLTTSDVPGHAMRVDDPARAQGAIIGKAMGSLETGEGLVLVMVGLQ